MKWILIVDDDQEVRENLEEILSDEGYATQSASSAKDALEAARNQKFDLVLLDYLMPEVTGIEILPELRRINPRSKIVMFTAFASIENAVEAIKKGAHEYLSKPFKIDHLLLLIRQLSEENRFERQIKKTNMEKTLSSLCNSIRRETIRMFRKRDCLRLMEITRELEIEDHTKVVFHLKSLKQAGLIIQEEDKSYTLTPEGKNILKCLDIMENFMSDNDN